jgi:hypothetical protein
LPLLLAAGVGGRHVDVVSLAKADVAATGIC